MDKRKKRILFTFIGVVAAIAVLAFVFFVIMPVLGRFFNEEHIEAILQRETGGRGLFILALLQAAQVVSVFFPGAVVQIAGGLVFGTLKSFFVCLFSFVITNVLVFLMAKKWQKHFHPDGAAKNNKVKKVILWINSSNSAFMCMLAYMMPGIPNGFVPYAAIHTEITWRQFLFSVFLGSIFHTFIMCSIGSRIKSEDYFASFLLTVFSLAMIVLLYHFKGNIISWAKKYRKQ